MSPLTKEDNKRIENLSILYDGGSLGAFACSVYKQLRKYKIQRDIIAGNSIGRINAAIITGSKRRETPR